MSTEPLDLLSLDQRAELTEDLQHWAPLSVEDAYRVMKSPLMANDSPFFRRVLEMENELAHLRTTSERFTDPTIKDAIAREITMARVNPGCSACWSFACPEHVAQHLVDAMRAERLVVLTVQAADEVIRNVEESK